MPAGEEVGRGRLLEATHRSQPLLQLPMIPRTAGVEGAGAAMFTCRQHVAEGSGIARRRIRDHPWWQYVRSCHGLCADGRSSGCIPPFRAIGSTDVTMLINCALDLGPRPIEADIPCIHPPRLTHWSSVCPRGFSKPWEQALHQQ